MLWECLFWKEQNVLQISNYNGKFYWLKVWNSSKIQYNYQCFHNIISVDFQFQQGE